METRRAYWSVFAAGACRAARATVLLSWAAASIVAGRELFGDRAFAACGDGAFDPGESCDDGDTQSDDGCSADCRLEVHDHYKCYKVKRAENAGDRGEIVLTDRFGGGTTRVGKPVAFCAPVDTNRDGVTDRSTHLTCYRVKGGGDLPSRESRTVLVGNVFGGRQLVARKPQTLCVPSVPVSGVVPLLIPCGDGVLDDGEECDDGNRAAGDGCSTACRLEPEQRYRCHDAKVRPAGAKFARRDVTLADGLESATMTAVKSVQLCAPADAGGQGVKDPEAHLECFKIRPVKGGQRTTLNREVEVLNEFGTERFTVVRAQSLCLASGEPASLQLPSIDPFKCYSAATAQGTPKFVARTVSLADEVETKTTKVASPALICNPAALNGSSLDDPTTHLTCYNISTVKGQGTFARPDVVVNNRFGTQTLMLTRPKALCSPAEVPPVPAAGNLDHFKCYAAKTAKGSTPFKQRRLSVADLFETKATQVRAPFMFCTAVSQDGQAIVDPAAQLTCYTIQDREGQPAFTKRDVGLTNQFGDAIWSASGVKTLCVPSVKVFAPDF
jgi:cysteine-rich repeat protein